MGAVAWRGVTIYFLFFCRFFFMSCDIGLGSALDLEAPEITIISPKSGENLPKTFTITGTCKDNVKVTRVIVQEQIGNQTRHLADAKIQGETWSAQITLSLYEEMESGTESFIISKTLTPYDYLKVSPNGSIYSPSWDFTEEELVEKSKSLKNGKHYLKVVYESLDNAGNKSSLINVGYFLWYPESDEPGVEINTEDDKLVINTGSIIPLTFFDDDGISEVGYDLITEKDKNDKEITLENLETHISQENKKTTEVFGKDDVQVQILTKKEDGSVLPSGKYYLLVYVKEKKTDKTPLSKKRLIEVTIIDDRKPFLIIEKPNENEIPKVEQNSKFTISGYSYDTSGSKFVKIAYIPGNDTNSAKDSRARTLLASDAVPRNLQGTTNGAPSIAGFPVRDGPSKPSPYSKNAYNIQNGEHIFVSYEFVSTWSVLLQQNNNSKGYGRSDYGQATYFCGYFHY